MLLKTSTSLLILVLSITSIEYSYAKPYPAAEALHIAVIPDITVSKDEVQSKLELSTAFTREFSKQQTLSRWWWWGWMSGLSVLGVGTLGLVLQESDDTPESLAKLEGNYISLGFIGLGILSTGLQRPKSINAFDELEAMPSVTAEHIRMMQARAEELRRQDIEQATRGNSWLAHTIPVVLASIAGTTLWLRHDDPWLGLRSFASTVIVTEIRMWMRPEFSQKVEQSHRTTSLNVLNSLALFPYSLEDGKHQGLALGGRF